MKKKIAVFLAFVLVVGLCVGIVAKKSYAKMAQMHLELPENVKKEQEIKVKVVLDSDIDLYSVDAYIAYDPLLLEYVPTTDAITGDNGILEIKDAFEEETRQKEYEITFKTLDVGNAYVNLTDVYLIDYQDLDYITVAPTDYSMEIGVNENIAEDARLSDLIVAPGDLTEAFQANKLNYEMHVGMDVDTISISAIAMDEDSVVAVDMPEVLQEGENLVTITVTALSGNENVYKIVVIKADWSEEEATTEETEDTTEIINDVVPDFIEPEVTTEVTTEITTEIENTSEAATEEITE